MHDKKTTCGWKNSNAVIRNSCFCFVQEKIIENNLQEFAWLYILEPEESTTTCYFLKYKANCIYGRFQLVFHSRTQLIYLTTGTADSQITLFHAETEDIFTWQTAQQ